MSGFDLDETQPDLQGAVQFGAEEMATPSWFTGSLRAPFMGIARGAAKINATFNEVTGTLLSPVFSTVDAAAGTDFHGFYRREITGRSFDWVENLKPDPMTTGVAGQVLFSLADIGTTAFVGGVLGGPAGAAAVAGSTEGEAYRQELLSKGVNPEAAAAAGALRAATTGVGVAVPLTLPARGVVPNLVYGATVSGAQGVIDRAGAAEILRQSNKPEMADQMQALDMTAILTDAVLGAAFSGVAAGLSVRAQRRGEIDAAMAAQKAKHASTDAAPGIPATPEAAEVHGRTFEEAMLALSADKEVRAPAEATQQDFVVRPDDMAKIEELPQVLEDFRAEEISLEEFERAQLEVNASGESAASLEAISRFEQEQARGQIRVKIGRDGIVTPLVGPTAVDTKARPGEVIAQRGIGKEEWTVLDQAEDVGKSGVARAMDAARKYKPAEAAKPEAPAPLPEVTELPFELPEVSEIGGDVPAYQSATAIAAMKPDLAVPLDEGGAISARDMAKQIDEELQQAQAMSKGFDAAVACVLGIGA